MKITVKELLESLTKEQKDALYRRLWYDYVCDDIRSYLEDNEEELTEEQIEYAANLYVYDGEYDCNSSYWTNIANVVEIARENS